MNKLKKTLTILLVVVLACSVFAGCGTPKETTKTEPTVADTTTTDANNEAPEVDHSPITYTIAGPGSAENVWTETHQFQWYAENLGITFDGGVTSEFNTKLQLWMADDSLPDVMTGWSGFSRSEVSKWAEEDYFLNFADYLDIMPNLSAFLEEHPDYKNFVTLDDGGIYGFARYNNNPNNGLFTPTYIRADLLKEANLEVPTNVDELYDALVAFKDMGVEYPFAYASATGTGGPDTANNWLALSYGMPYGTYTTSSVGFIVDDDTVAPTVTSENYKAYIKYLNKLYTDDLIAKESFSLTAEQYDSILCEGEFGVARAYQSLPGTDAEKIENFTLLPALATEYVSNPTLTLNNRLTAEFFFMVSADIENPERICELVDFCFTTEGYNIARWGVEGQSYDIKSIGDAKLVDSSKYVAEYAEKGVTNFDAIVRSFDTFSIVDLGFGGSFAAMDACKDDSTLLNPEMIAIAGQNILRQKMLNDNKDLVLIDGYPATSAYITDNDRYSTIVTDILSYMVSVEADFITGAKDVDGYWDEYIKTLDQIGINDLTEMEQTAYNVIIGK